MQLLQQTLKISSLELVEQINIFRKQEREIYSEEKNRLYADITHDSLLKIIRDEFEEEISLGELNDTQYTHPQNKQEYKMFLLTTSQAKQVLVRESKMVRKAVIAYIEKIESAKPKELSRKEILLLALESEERAIVAETKLLEAKPKIEFYDQVADTTTSFDMQEVAGMLKLSYGRNILFKKLRAEKVLMNDNLPYRNLLDDGKFIVVETKWMNPKTEQATATTQTRITQKGLDWLQKNKEKLGL